MRVVGGGFFVNNSLVNLVVVCSFLPSLFTRVDVWSVGIGQSFSWTINYGILQMGLQRYSSLPTYRKAMQ